MAAANDTILQFWRGVAANEPAAGVAAGEPVFLTDTSELKVGDGGGGAVRIAPRNFLELGDTFNAFTGLGSQLLRVNAGATAVESFDGATVYVTSAQIGAANGVASLDAGGLIPTAQMPNLALTSVTVVADDTARNALTVEEGDAAIVTSSALEGGNSATYLYDGAAWQLVTSPDGATTWLGNTDTPGAYVAGQYPVVNAGATAIEFTATIPATAITNSAITNLTATNVDAALAELQGDIDTINTSLGTQAAITITGTDGVGGGGSLAANRTLNLDLNGLTALAGTGVDSAADFFVVYDASATAHRKVAASDVIGSASWVGLDDTTDTTLAAKAGFIPKVNAGATAIELVNTISGGTF